MISYKELKKISRIRIRDAKLLLDSGSYDSSLYLCGYAVEIALKAIICKNFEWRGIGGMACIPNTSQEFATINSLKTHNIDSLLGLIPPAISTGIKSNTKRFGDWSTVHKWNPEMRYAPIKGSKMKTESTEVMASTQKILRYLWRQI